jgi:hypothetical protein
MSVEPARCGCPGPYNTIAKEGVCDRCGVEGPDHHRALERAFASGRFKAAIAEGRQQGRQEGYRRGVEVGRRQAVEALAEREVERRPFEREKEHEMEIGA